MIQSVTTLSDLTNRHPTGGLSYRIRDSGVVSLPVSPLNAFSLVNQYNDRNPSLRDQHPQVSVTNSVAEVMNCLHLKGQAKN